MIRYFVLLATTASLVGCATPPKPLRGSFAPVVPIEAAGAERVGDLVRWGGRIVAVDTSPAQTCFEILGRELAADARPVKNADQSHGRFIACRAGFYDPAIFTTERDVTITGRVSSFETRRIGAYDYRYPHIAAEVIYLWPQQVLQQPRPYYNDPFWPGYYGYWGYRYPPILIRTAPRNDRPAPQPAPSK